MSRVPARFLGCLIALLPVACVRSNAPPPVADARTDGEAPMAAVRVVERPAKEAPAAEVAKLVEGNAAFAFELYRKLGTDKQVFISPYSISTALGMLYAGARGATAEEIAKVCHFNTAPEGLPHVHATLLWKQLGDAKAAGYEWHEANALWVRRGAAFRQEYLDLLKRGFAADARVADFGGPAASAEIAHWLARQTRNRIPNLRIETDGDTQMVLANAVYFKADWQHPFLPSSTYDEEFRVTTAERIKTPFMHHPAIWLGYFGGDAFEMVELGYVGHASMWVLLPKRLGTAELDAVLTADNFNVWLTKKQSRRIVVSLPKFEVRQQLKLPEILKALGMRTAFTPQADFSAALAESMFVNQVVHGAFVKLDEQGTEAAAGTVIEAKKEDAPEVVIDFRVDRPFVVVIRDNRTGSILFLGRVVDPRGSA